ncbi:DUF177 domain-containing protein [Bacillaceae bacterium SIJ1]|uniref:YceD family protein n=1 Tax=Litoribacterium kuwaitense TaxID=1398745 RepID=UPI0013EA642C|nr:YceD family protein [Litoribacterium kuwaitense]NGP44356.1 DUF177 domain-containing protein [Litoribacterium kuwaitense]
MKWHFNELGGHQDDMFSFSEDTQVKELLQKRSSDIRDASPFHVKGYGYRSGNRYVFHLKMKGTLVLPCARTLLDVEFPLSFSSTEIFALENETSDYDEDWDDDLHPVIDGFIDLTPYVIERILLQIPMKVYKEDIPEQSPAPQKGEDWEVVTEELKKSDVDPRLASLQRFFDKDDENA